MSLLRFLTRLCFPSLAASPSPPPLSLPFQSVLRAVGFGFGGCFFFKPAGMLVRWNGQQQQFHHGACHLKLGCGGMSPWGIALPWAMLQLLYWAQEVAFPQATLPLVSPGGWEGGTHWRWWWDPVRGDAAGVWWLVFCCGSKFPLQWAGGEEAAWSSLI